MPFKGPKNLYPMTSFICDTCHRQIHILGTGLFYKKNPPQKKAKSIESILKTSFCVLRARC